MEHDRSQLDERLTKKPFQFGIFPILLLTAVTAVVLACAKYLPFIAYLMIIPVAFYGLIILAFVGVPIIPFAILFATIALGPEKKGHLSINHGWLKFLVASWIICVIISASTCLLIYLGFVY